MVQVIKMLSGTHSDLDKLNKGEYSTITQMLKHRLTHTHKLAQKHTYLCHDNLDRCVGDAVGE